MKVDLDRTATAILFALLFISVGWLAPALYASNAPADHYIEVHSFTAENVSTDAEQHYICFDRTVYEPHTGDVIIELYLVSEEGQTTEVAAFNRYSYFQYGTTAAKIPLALPDNLEEGEYHYIIVSKAELADGRVIRQFKWESQNFHVGPEYNGSDEFHCG